MINAVFDMLIVKVIFEEKGTIILPAWQRAKEQNAGFYGNVISIGPEFKEKLKVGDRLHFPRNEGYLIEWSGEKYMALRHKWHLAKEEV